MSTSDICKISSDDETSAKTDGVCEVNDMLQKMNTVDGNIVSICANCGKEDSSDNMNTCNKCKQVKYCNAACKKKHRSKHKKKCERYVAELHDNELFKQTPSAEDCPICFLRLPTLYTGYRYMTCCGKVICCGCIHTGGIRKGLCPFCRTRTPASDEETIEREMKRVKAGDAYAIYNQGCDYNLGSNGLPRDHTKALELWYRSAELGNSKALCGIGVAYQKGRGVEVDIKKAKHYYELASMMGNEVARHNLGIREELDNCNMDRALKHFIIAVRSGHSESLKCIQDLYTDGHTSKEDYTKALKLYQAYLSEIKSVQRDKAAAADDQYRYY